VNSVLACSALKEEYRRAIVPEGSAADVRFVYLDAPASVLHERLANRVGHYAGPQLLASQLDTLEEPRDALWVDATCAPQEIVTRIRLALGV
jgi:gluconokinase